MNKFDLSLSYKSATELLTKKRLAEALEFLYSKTTKLGMNELAAETEQIKDNYARLLQYVKNGTTDPTREDQLDALFAKAWEVTECLCYQSGKEQDEYLSDELTLQMIEDYQLSEQLEGQARDEALGKLFCRIKNSFPLSREVRRSLHSFMLNEQIPVFERATFLSAITLNMMQWFDTAMLENIYSYTLDDQPTQIRIQAFVSLVLCGMLYDHRIAHEPRLRELYRMIVETEGEILAAIQVTMLSCQSAPSFHQKLTNVVKVELGKIRTGQVPMDFQEFLSLFQDGVDHEYNSFKRFLKDLPFFHLPKYEHHWLMPFSLEHYWVEKLAQSHPDTPIFLKMINGSLSQSDSSKYAHLCLVAEELPKVIEQIKNQIKDLPISLEEVASPDGYTILRNYLHDLYRYLTITPCGKSIKNPLNGINDFEDYLCLREESEDLDRLEKTCQALYKRSEWGQAMSRLQRLTRQRVTPELLAQLAVAAEKSGHYEVAQEALCRHLALYSSNKDIYVQLAQDYDHTKSYVAEESLLHEALKQYPDSMELMLQMATCLNHQERANEAIPLLHRTELHAEGDPRVKFQLAYAYLMMAQGQEAEFHLQSCLNSADQIPAYWTLGTIISLHLKDLNTAMQRYNRLCEMQDNPAKAFQLVSDEKQLARHSGTDLSALTLLHDVRQNSYKLNEQ